MNEWPKTLYRPAEAGGLEHKSFASEADVPEGQGWTDFKAAKAASKPAPAAPTRAAGDMERLQKQVSELMEKLNKAQAQVAVEKAAAQETRSSAIGAQDRVGELEQFLTGLSADANCPDALKLTITKLLTKKGKKARAAA